ncbi:hypothetical protein U1Q18_051214 [Sarracenia purpurea var. burkii]
MTHPRTFETAKLPKTSSSKPKKRVPFYDPELSRDEDMSGSRRSGAQPLFPECTFRQDCGPKTAGAETACQSFKQFFESNADAALARAAVNTLVGPEVIRLCTQLLARVLLNARSSKVDMRPYCQALKNAIIDAQLDEAIDLEEDSPFRVMLESCKPLNDWIPGALLETDLDTVPMEHDANYEEEEAASEDESDAGESPPRGPKRPRSDPNAPRPQPVQGTSGSGKNRPPIVRPNGSVVVLAQAAGQRTNVAALYGLEKRRGNVPNQQWTTRFLTQGQVMSIQIKDLRAKGEKKAAIKFETADGRKGYYNLNIAVTGDIAQTDLTKNRVMAMMHVHNYEMKFDIISALGSRIQWSPNLKRFSDVFIPLTGAGFQFIGMYIAAK